MNNDINQKGINRLTVFLYYFRYLYLLLFLLSGKLVQAQQVFPVLSTLQINPPYSLYLNDYSAPGSDKMQVRLFLKDLTKNNYPCRLRFKLEGFGITIQNKNDFYAQPIYLNAGELSTFSGSDLEVYFNPKNLVLQGLDQTAFSRNGGKLPEGVYRVSVEVLDYYQHSVVSNAGSTVLSVFLSYPPIINSPLPGSKVQALEPQNVIFQWVPRHTGSINAAYNVAYNFRLVELIPADRDPNDAIRSARPMFETVTDQTILLYGPAEPALTPGSSYAVQIQAVEADGKDLFINNGNSEVVKFTYGDKCAPPVSILAELTDANSLKFSWSALPLQQAFSIRYREANNQTAQWFEQETYTPQFIAQGLRPGKTYEYQVKAQCINGYGDYTQLQQFQMPDEKFTQGDFVCGKQSPAINLDKTQLLDLLLSGNVFTAGDFEVTVTSVTASQNGVFSGTGTIAVPVLANLQFNVVFQDIRINSKYQMVDGLVKVKEQTLEQSQEQVITAITLTPDANGLVHAVSSNGLPTIIDAAVAVSGNLPVYNAANKTIKFAGITNSGESKEITIQLKGDQPPFTFQDKNGQTYEVDKDGKVSARGIVPKSELLAGGSSTSKPLSTDKAKIIFKPSPKQKYGLDLFKDKFKSNSRYTGDYQQIKENSKTTNISWKSIESGRGDEVLAELQTTDPSIDSDKVEFRNGRGESISSKREGKSYTIQLQGAPEGNDKEIYAFYPTGKDKDIGINLAKLNIASFRKITKKVVIVPVNGAGKDLSETDLSNTLNEIYKQGIVEWEVKVKPTSIPTTDWDTNHDGRLDAGNSSAMSAYTAEQKVLAGMYKKQAGLKDGTYYIFLVNKFSVATQQGYMVRGGQVGFLAVGDQALPPLGEVGRGLAHELGHGAFHLKHNWEETGISQGESANLMDYATTPTGSAEEKTELWHYQWHYMRNPDLVFRPFEGDEEGASLAANKLVSIIIDTDSKISDELTPFLSPIGEPVYLNRAEIALFTYNSNNGVLVGFKLKNNLVYTFNSKTYTDNNGNAYPVSKTPAKGEVEVLLFKKFDDCKVELRRVTIQYPNLSKIIPALETSKLKESLSANCVDKYFDNHGTEFIS
ncbi:MAG: fibronectin type III domain-containing protein, partial [Daejeonella sp.]